MESKDKESNPTKATMELANLLKDYFNGLTLNTREKVWAKITSKKGENEVKELIRNPSRSINSFRTL
jgi:hypothetical protein